MAGFSFPVLEIRMPKLFGSLSVFMFITLPSGRDKRVTLASIPCDYSEREEMFRKFIDDNGSRLLKAPLHAEFVARDSVFL
jgi:hypothetical protein